jgi:osmoprotectant transport system ATP-binding protein
MELIERVGLDPAFAKRYPAQLSGGQQQRVGVARALAADPPVMLMDEPFSAVDPVVRDQLQAEFLRLQDELGKTIVFVTHDIDEAIKLGDQVAVLRVGGKLAQLASPSELLSRPVDAFVAGFVGRDRGYRALGFTTAGSFQTHEEPTVRMGDPLPAQDDEWLLAVDAAGAPQGWLHLSDEPKGGVVEDRMLYRGGTLATEGGSLRGALDACLSSPSGRGVVVDENGRLVGSTTAREVLDLIEAEGAGSAEGAR